MSKADLASEKKLEPLVESDANAHHTVWGSSDINLGRGVYYEYLMAQGLLVQTKETH